MNLPFKTIRTIAEVQRNIIETVNKEAPFDVFICYKESDDRGQRTLDSTLAQDNNIAAATA